MVESEKRTRAGARVAAAAAGALLAGALAGPARAQEPLEIRVVEGERPLAGAFVVVLVDDQPWELGPTDAAGRRSVPSEVATLVADELLAVRVADDAGLRTVVIGAPGEGLDAECARRAGGGACRPSGVFLWGDDVTIDLAAGAVRARPRRGPAVAERPEPARPQPAREPEPEFEDEPDFEPAAGRARREPPPWVVAIGGGYAAWPNLDLACGVPLPAGVARCELTSEGPTARGSIEVRPGGIPVGLAGDVSYSPGLEVVHALLPVVGAPVENRVELDVWTAEALAVLRHPLTESIDAVIGAGWAWATLSGEATTTFAGGRTATEDRSDSGGRFTARAGLDWWAARRTWGVRLEGGGMTGEGDDATAGWHAAALLLWAPGAR